MIETRFVTSIAPWGMQQSVVMLRRRPWWAFWRRDVETIIYGGTEEMMASPDWTSRP